MLERLEFIRYNSWANRRVGEMLAELEGAELERSLQLFSHLLRAEQVWLGRIHATPDATLPLWETDTLAVCRERLEANARALEQLAVGSFAGSSVDTARIDYTTTQGVTYTTPVSDILAHVLNHGTHHRGQIALLVREAGRTPLPLDLIAYLRLKS